MVRYKKVKTISEIKKLSLAEQASFYADDNNLLFVGNKTASDIHELMTEDSRYAVLTKASVSKKEALVEMWQKCWTFANEENHSELFLRQNSGFNSSDVENDWQNAVDYFYKRTRDAEDALSEKDIESVKETAKLREAFSLKDDFLRLFNQKSYQNEIIGECLFYSFIMVLLRKRGVEIESKNSMMDKLISPLAFFCTQESGSGKDQALDFLEELINEINTTLRIKKKHSLLIKYENLSGGESPEIYFSRPELDNKGVIKIDKKTGEPLIIKGKLERNDVLLVRECSFLFRIKGKERQNILEILLQVLEGREISKELVSWGKHVIPTRSNCAYIGMSRPVIELQEVITSSGLLQRGLFYGRTISREEREKMDDMIAAGSVDKEKYRKDFKVLAQRITDFYINIDSDVFRMEDSKLGRELIHSYKKKKRDFVYDEIQSDLLQEVLNTFINRIDEVCIKLSYVNCYSRGGSIPDEADIQSSLNILGKIFDSLILWLDTNLVDVTRKDRQTLEYRLRKEFKDAKVIKQSVIIKAIIKITSCCHPTAMTKLKKNLVGRNRTFLDAGDKLYLLNKS